MSYPYFLESELPPTEPDSALFHVFPAPLENSVSYGSGAARGPEAIIKASSQLETWDGKSEPVKAGIYTYPAVTPKKDTESYLEELARNVEPSAEAGKIPVVLGGEHTVTLGPVEALLRAHKEPFGVIQFDAHADLRDTYEGSPYSHACVMRRLCDWNIPIFQIGVRAVSKEETEFRNLKKIPCLDASALAAGKPFQLPRNFPRDVYITFDVDGLDPSVIPATGTPVPGGLGWYQTLDILEKIIKKHTIIGFDVVELAPTKGLHYPEFAAAELTYRIMGMIQRSRS